MKPELDDIDGRLQRFYERQSPSASLVNRLAQQVESGGRPRRAWLAGAVVLVMILAGTFLAMRWKPDSIAANRVSELAARDVALHHRKQFSLDYQSDSMEQLSRELSKLDFKPVMPVRLNHGNRLVSARFCAVLGQIAAQFRFIDGEGRPCTLYQTRCQGDFANLPESQFEIEGTHVELWRKAGLLMVLAYSG